MELITVAEYKDRYGYSLKTIYKWIKQGKLKTEKKKVNNKDTIFIIIEDESEKGSLPPSPSNEPFLQGVEPISPRNEPPSPSFSPRNEPPSPTFLPQEEEASKAERQEENIISFLQEQIRQKDKQIAEKDRQIAEKDKQLEKIQQLLDQEQQLHARTNLLLTEYKEKEENPLKDQEKKKKNWFMRWMFGEE